MRGYSRSERVTTLAHAMTGEVVAVQGIVFECTRALCRELGIRTGDVLRCAERNGHRLTVEQTSGAAIELDSFYACFIAVERLPQKRREELAAPPPPSLGGRDAARRSIM